jgi:hypothetical protein
VGLVGSVPRCSWLKPNLTVLFRLLTADVCTHPDFQRQGAVAQILTDITEHFESELPSLEDCEAAVAALHCMPALRPVYGKYGFRSVPAYRSVLNIMIPPIRTLAFVPIPSRKTVARMFHVLCFAVKQRLSTRLYPPLSFFVVQT